MNAFDALYSEIFLSSKLVSSNPDLDSFIEKWIEVLPVNGTRLNVGETLSLLIFGRDDFLAYNEDLPVLNECGFTAWALATTNVIVTFFESVPSMGVAFFNLDTLLICHQPSEIEALAGKSDLTLRDFFTHLNDPGKHWILEKALIYRLC